MGRMAADVVLLPDEAMTRRAIEINRRLVTNDPPEIVLNDKDCLPHISLAMGGIEEGDVDAMGRCLEKLARETAVRQLKIVGIQSSTNSRGQTVSVLEVERTRELQTLHERVMTEMKAFFRYEVRETMIYGGVAKGTTLDWIRTYPQKAGYEHFSPHITLGYGAAPADLSFPIPFTAARLALCHLGNHCTCRKIIEEWKVGIVE
jgi:2'-5' RNA ligase